MRNRLSSALPAHLAWARNGAYGRGDNEARSLDKLSRRPVRHDDYIGWGVVFASLVQSISAPEPFSAKMGWCRLAFCTAHQRRIIPFPSARIYFSAYMDAYCHAYGYPNPSTLVHTFSHEHANPHAHTEPSVEVLHCRHARSPVRRRTGASARSFWEECSFHDLSDLLHQ